MNVLVSILGLGALVLIHELGHFLTSLALRMRPRRFYVGFPPAVWKTEHRGIEYGVGAIPLGGMVKIPGMHRPAPGDVDHAFHRAQDEAPALQPPLATLRELLAAGDLEAARTAVDGVRATLATVELTPPVRRAADRGVQDIGDALGSDAYWRAATWKRVAVIAAGPVANIVLAIALFTGLYLQSGGPVTTTVKTVETDSPAAAMGLRAGDVIVRVDGRAVTGDTLSNAINASGGAPITLRVRRDGTTLTLGPTRPRLDEELDRYRLGLSPVSEGLSLPAAARSSVSLTWEVTKDIGGTLGELVRGNGSENISSPVGIVRGSSEAASAGTESFLWVLGLLSLSIALLNLLPLLPLDGGHIAFAVIEGIRGRSVRREIYERVSMVGIAIVVLLFFIGLSNDVNRLS